MNSRKRDRLATDTWYFRETIVATFYCLAASVGTLLILNLALPDKPFLVGLITTCAISFFVAFPLLMALHKKDGELRNMREKVNYAARHDALTGTLNARSFASAIEHYVERRKKTGSESGGIMIAVVAESLDDISRRYGPQWADSVMQSLATIIQSSVRSGDLVARLATNELGIFLPGALAENAQDIGRRIRSRLAETTFAAKDTPLTLEVKIGGTVFETAAEFNDIRQMADEMAFEDDEARPLPLGRLHAS